MMKVFLVGLFLMIPLFGEERVWDQEKAMHMTQEVIDLEEKQGQPWDKIKWETDPAKAKARMMKEKKPGFVYFYVDKGGPAAAPC